jgi:hypothetical protein
VADDDNALSRGLTWVDNWLARYGQRDATPIWDQSNPIGTETLQTMGMPQPTTYAGPVGRYVDPTSGQLTTRGRGQMDNPMMGFDTGGTGIVGAIHGYHGSPHLFAPTARNPLGEFDLSKIGTGEGAQAYGYGPYIAEREANAQQYRDQLRWKGADWHDPQIIAGNAIDRAGGDRGAAADSLQSALDSNTNFYRGKVPAAQAAANANTAKAISLLRGAEPITGQPPTQGHMYEVNIHADPEHFLDWDKPLGDQSQYVQDALNKTEWFPYAQEQLERRGLDNPTGKSLHKWLGDDFDPPESAKMLQDAGIKGIQYLDAGSRAAGEGSRNYVVFSPKIMEIIRRYGIAGLMAGGGAAAIANGGGGDATR